MTKYSTYNNDKLSNNIFKSISGVRGKLLKIILRKNVLLHFPVFISLAIIGLTIIQLRYSNRVSCHFSRNNFHQNVSSTTTLKKNQDALHHENYSETFITEDALERKCISPEQIDWIFGGNGTKGSNDRSTMLSVESSTKSCSLCNISPSYDTFSRFLNDLSEKIEMVKKESCYRVVVYTVAFGKNYINSFTRTHPTIIRQYHQYHNQCLFVFALDENNMKKDYSEYEIKFLKTKDMSEVLIPVPKDVLPYKNMRRNTKLFKFLGDLIFPWAERLVWQDAKFRMWYKYPDYRPKNYFHYIENTLEKTNTCATYLGMPVHKSSLGSSNVDLRHEGFRMHCDLLSSSRRKSVSDSQKGIKTQCSYYNEYVNKNFGNRTYGTSSELLSSYMVDSALFIRDMRSEKCRKFNAELSCKWLKEIHCFSDRDQISFPLVLASMGVHEYNDINVDPVQKHRVFVDNQDKPLVLILKSSCHYYFKKSIENCFILPGQVHLPPNIDLTVSTSTLNVVPNHINKMMVLPSMAATDFPIHKNKIKTAPKTLSANPTAYDKRVAVIVSGTTRSYFLKSSLEYLIKPLSNQSHHVDCFIALTTGDIPAYGRKEPYMNHLVPDPILNKAFFGDDMAAPIEVDVDQVDFLRHNVENYGGKLRRIILRRSINIDTNELVKSRRKQVLKRYPREDPDLRFPVKDLRTHQIKIRTANTNREMLRMQLGVQMLWESLLKAEEEDGMPYDYIIFLRDDALWLEEFDLDHLIALGHADTYLLSCDGKEPPLTVDEVNDHAIIASRNVASYFGKYFTHLFKHNLEKCTSSIHTRLGHLRGCNSEMILKWMIKQNNISVLKVGQKFIPFQRAARVRNGGNVTVCFHKYCQSNENRLDDKGIKRCIT